MNVTGLIVGSTDGSIHMVLDYLVSNSHLVEQKLEESKKNLDFFFFF